MAHELRTPLANGRSHLEAVQDGVLPLDPALVGSLLEEQELLERLVNDLHDLTLADADMLRVHPEERQAGDLAGRHIFDRFHRATRFAAAPPAAGVSASPSPGTSSKPTPGRSPRRVPPGPRLDLHDPPALTNPGDPVLRSATRPRGTT